MDNIVSTVKNIDPAKVCDTVAKGSAETVKNIDPANVCDTVAKGSRAVSAGAKVAPFVGAAPAAAVATAANAVKQLLK